MAALHWAYMVLGGDQQSANAAVGRFNRSTCHRCIRGGGHASLLTVEYARIFCLGATRIPNRDALYSSVEVGDVLITDNIGRPAHTMIVRQKRRADHVTVRGFNNYGTLGTGERDSYDPVSHNITQEKYWTDGPNGKFGVVGVDLFVIRAEAFLNRAQLAAMKFMGRVAI